MGNKSSSSTTNKIENNVINETTLKNLNETVSTQVTKIIMTQQTQSMASSTKTNSIQIGNITSSGEGSIVDNINLQIDMNASITFNSNMSSAQNSSIQANIANAISQVATASLSADQKSAMVSATTANQEVAGLALTGGNSNSAKTNNDTKNTSVNRVDQEFTNIVTNTIMNTQETANIQSCIVQQISQNSITAGNIAASNGGKISNVTMTIHDTATVVGDCIFNSIQGSGVLNTIATTMGLKVETAMTAKQTAESSATTSASQTITGIFSLASLASCSGFIVLLIIVSIIYKVITGTVSAAAGSGSAPDMGGMEMGGMDGPQ
jgi:hypothetical protein